MWEQLTEITRAIAGGSDRRKAAGAEIPGLLTHTVEALQRDYLGETPDDPLRAERWADLTSSYGLSSMEQVALAMAVSAELDPNFALAYGLLQGGSAPHGPSIALVFELAGLSRLSPERSLFSTGSTLLEQQLLTVQDGAPFPQQTLGVPDRVVEHLMGADDADPLTRGVELDAVPMTFAGTAELAAAVEAGNTVCYVESPAGAAGLSLATGALHQIDISWLAIDLGLADDSLPERTVRAALRDATLTRRALVVQLGSHQSIGPTMRQLATAKVPVLVIGRHGWDVRWLTWLPPVVRAVPLTPAARDACWIRQLPELADQPMLPTFRLTPEQIRDVADRVRADAAATDSPVTLSALQRVSTRVALASIDGSGGRPDRGAGGLSGDGLPGSRPGVRRIEPAVGLADVRLPPRTLISLRQVIEHYRMRREVLQSHPFLARSGSTAVTALFSGTSGTGKTLAAQAVAAELGRELLSVDLSAVVDKYIGETEKNLERVFELAETTGDVLFFDEADALFGTRSKVTDSRDKYANQGTAWLLQRLEVFDGLGILATNLRGNLDSAFLRRLRFVILFDRPDPELRIALWKQHLADVTEFDQSDPVDHVALAADADLSGGEIRNVALAAIYDALGRQEPLGMRHLLRAVAGEFHKLGRRLPAPLAALAANAETDPRDALNSSDGEALAPAIPTNGANQ